MYSFHNSNLIKLCNCTRNTPCSHSMNQKPLSLKFLLTARFNADSVPSLFVNSCAKIVTMCTVSELCFNSYEFSRAWILASSAAKTFNAYLIWKYLSEMTWFWVVNVCLDSSIFCCKANYCFENLYSCVLVASFFNSSNYIICYFSTGSGSFKLHFRKCCTSGHSNGAIKL